MSYKEYEFDSTTEWHDDGVDCTITFEYTPPSKMTNDCPGYDGEVEIISVMIDGHIKDAPAIDIVDLVGSVEFALLETKCFEYVKEDEENYAENLADYKYNLIKDEGLM